MQCYSKVCGEVSEEKKCIASKSGIGSDRDMKEGRGRERRLKGKKEIRKFRVKEERQSTVN